MSLAKTRNAPEGERTCYRFYLRDVKLVPEFKDLFGGFIFDEAPQFEKPDDDDTPLKGGPGRDKLGKYLDKGSKVEDNVPPPPKEYDIVGELTIATEQKAMKRIRVRKKSID